jgi:hypothetical protein
MTESYKNSIRFTPSGFPCLDHAHSWMLSGEVLACGRSQEFKTSKHMAFGYTPLQGDGDGGGMNNPRRGEY